jgi:Cu/Ag efflux protein CusF
VRTEGGLRRRRFLLLGAGLAALAAGAGAWFLWLRPEDLSGPGMYHGTGVVLAVLAAPSPFDAKRPVIVLRHDAIPGLMEKSMTHPFVIRSAKLLRGIGLGSPVRFTLKDTPGALLVVRLEVIQK